MAQGFAIPGYPTSLILAALQITGLTALLPIVTDASKNLVSLAYTGATSFRKNLGLEPTDAPTFDSASLVKSGAPAVLTLFSDGNSSDFEYIDFCSDEATDKIWRITHKSVTVARNHFSWFYSNDAGSTFAHVLTLTPAGFLGVGNAATVPQCGIDLQGGSFRISGSDSPSSGFGIEFQYTGTEGVIFAIDRTASLTKPLLLNHIGGNVGINMTSFPTESLDIGTNGSGNINCAGVYKVDTVQVVGNRVIDARCADAINSGDATTDGVIDALRDAMIAHGLIAAA